jgi:hypothetical protein
MDDVVVQSVFASGEKFSFLLALDLNQDPSRLTA